MSAKFEKIYLVLLNKHLTCGLNIEIQLCFVAFM